MATPVSQLPPAVLPVQGTDYLIVDQANAQATTGYVTRRATVSSVISATAALVLRVYVQPYSATMAISNTAYQAFSITATNGTAFAISNPTLVLSGVLLVFTIKNTSGGALGTATWDALYKLAAWTQPATGYSRSITFLCDGTNFIELSRTAADVPN